ncbi:MULTISPECIES: ribosome rescue protein RqcH [Halobacterium]|uniref:ribosome rescue protein RqcH n=1 Tax=Halobacterium TaxID=2239 RepID=UPI00073F40EF|nr:MULTISPECIES: ribosome rescue protein RqcH [Halobacterium]MCG1003449.1 NFACT family protein [Halobacterium noricense]
MDQKRELTSVDLVALTAELNGYQGAKVDKAYLYGDDLLRLKMRDFDRGRVELLIEVGDTKRAHAAAPEHVPDAPGRPPNFAKMLRNRLSGADFHEVRQHGFDRILEFEFRREDQDTTIVAELFGDGNIAVVDQNGEVVDSLDTVRLQSRTVAPGSQYGFPSARVNPLELDYEGFVAKMRESDTDLVRTLATQLNFGGLYGEELCTRAGVEKTKDIDDADEEEFRALYDASERLLDAIRSGDLEPRVYFEPGDGEDEDGKAARGQRVDVTPLALEERTDLPAEAYDRFNDALDDYFTNLDTTEEEESGEAVSKPDFEQEIQKHQHIIKQQEQAIEDFAEQADAEREKAELLYANYDLVDDILSTVQDARDAGHGWQEIAQTFEDAAGDVPGADSFAGINESEGTVRIRLDDHTIEVDPAWGVEKNADEHYKEAKRIEGKQEGARAAIENTREDLEAAKQRREEWDAEPDEPDEDEADREIDWLSRSSIPIRKQEQWYERFRWFRTSDGFLVIGGRNADQNEELVKKYMDRYDRFFHAQAHGGPVTVLKTSAPSEPSNDIEVPESSKRQAAQFAVCCSSVWKDGRGSGDAYMVTPDQVSKTPESGEYLEKGGFAIRGDRTYFRDLPAEWAVGISCEPHTRVLGGPIDAIADDVEATIELEPGRYAQGDAAKRIYREFRERFADESFVRKVASPDEIQKYMPPGGSRIRD